MSFHEQPHRRFNPLKDEWILVSPHRTQRPWQGQQDRPGAACRVEKDKPLFRAALANGTCRVICFSPDHGKTLPEMSVADIRNVVDSWHARGMALPRISAVWTQPTRSPKMTSPRWVY
jgi:UDPglucose--hexose-1-phosphate uridylyltransferase